MATATIATALTRITDADSLTGWSSIGGGPGAAATSDIYIQLTSGTTGAIGRRVQTGGRGFWFDNGTGIDFTVSGRYLWIWINLALGPNLCDLRANGGLCVRVGTTSTNWSEFAVGGGDVTPGGWIRYCLDIANMTAYGTGGAGLTLTSCQWFGVFYRYTAAPGGNIPHVVVDAIDYGPGLTVYGGTTGDRLTWADISAATESQANAYGVLQQLANGTYLANGQLVLGQGANDMYLEDENQTVIWQQQDYYTGSAVASSVPSGFHELQLVESTGTTDFTDGVLVGTDGGRNGSTFAVADTINAASIDLNDANVTNVSLYGTTFRQLQAEVSLCADATNGPNHEAYGCTFADCAQVDVGRVEVRNCVFSGHTGTSSALLWNENIDIADCQFLGNTDTTNNPAGIEHPVNTSSPYTYDGLTFSGNDFDILYSQGNGTLTINAINNSNPATSTATGTGSVTINNAVVVSVEAVESSDASQKVTGARVILYETPVAVSSITRASSTATVTTSTAHGFTTGDEVMVRGANQPEYNGVVTITVTSTTQFTYTVSGTPATPATGTIETAFMVIDRLLTDGTGVAQNTGYNYSTDQAVEGFVRKSTSSPAYKTQPISGTIRSGGLAITAPMVRD